MCSTTGALEYGHAPGLDVFPSQSAAVAHLRRRGVCKTVTEGCALLGCAAFGDCALALIAKRVRTAVVLPNGHEVLTVTEAQWVRCALRNPAAVLTREERANVQALADIPLENLYFYCETFDVTRSFAHATDESIASPDGEWVWNEWLASPVRRLGIPGACPALLQGLAESRAMTDAKGVEWRLAVFGRRRRRDGQERPKNAFREMPNGTKRERAELPRGKLRADLSGGPYRRIRGVVPGGRGDRRWSGAVVVLRVAPGLRSHSLGPGGEAGHRRG